MARRESVSVVRLQEANFHINKSTSSALALRKANFEQRIDVPHALCKKRRTATQSLSRGALVASGGFRLWIQADSLAVQFYRAN